MHSQLFIAITLACWAAWGIFEKKALQHSSNKDVVIILYVLRICQIPMVIFLLNVLEPGWHLTRESISLSFLGSCMSAVALVSYLIAMSKVEASLILTSTACYPIISIFLANSLLGEKFLVSQLIGTIISALGMIGIGFSINRPKNTGAPQAHNLVIICACLATFCWGICGVIDKQAVSIASVLEVFLGKCMCDAILLLIVLTIFKFKGYKPALRNAATWYSCGLSSLCLALGGCSYLAALEKLSASYVISITACYPVVMYILAIAFLKEQFNKVRFAGITLAVLGTVLVQIARSS